MKCEIIAEVHPKDPFRSYGPSTCITVCRTHGISLEGVLPIKDDLCIVGRIERLEALSHQGKNNG